MTQQQRAYLYAALAVFFWSTVATAFKLALTVLDFIQLLWLASFSSCVVLIAVLFKQGRVHKLWHQSHRAWLHSAGLGLINPFLYYLLLFKAYDVLPAQEALALNYTWPLVLSLLSVPLLKQRLRLISLLAIVLSFMGVLIIATRGQFSHLNFANPTGTLFALSSSLGWALFWIFNLRDQREPVLKLASSFLFGVVYTTVALLLWSHWPPLHWGALLSGVYVGCFEMGITFILWLKALSLARDSASISNIAYLAPFISLVFIAVILGETILLSSILGLILIICGILIQTLRYYY